MAPSSLREDGGRGGEEGTEEDRLALSAQSWATGVAFCWGRLENRCWEAQITDPQSPWQEHLILGVQENARGGDPKHSRESRQPVGPDPGDPCPKLAGQDGLQPPL